MTNRSSLQTKLMLSDLYASNTVYTSRPSYISNPWLDPEEHQSNFLTGRELIIADNMPVIVHKASVTDKLEQLFAEIGKSLPQNVYTFSDKSSYEMLLKNLVKEQQKTIYFQYIHDPSLLSKEAYALDKDIFVALNNKAKIPKWTNDKYLPQREVVAFEAFEERVQAWQFPFVIKPGDDLPTAGGYGVMICYNDTDLSKAIQRIRDAKSATKQLIIEQKIEAVANYCVQFAYSHNTGVQYIGAAEQITNDYGFYHGNQNVNNVPSHVIKAGEEIMKNGVAQGFFGIAGFDLLVDKFGDVYAIDLNFRQNGSTSMLLLEPSLNKGYHKFYSYVSDKDNTKFYQTILKYVKKGVLFPLSYYDGDWFEHEDVSSRFGCIWHAATKAEVERLEAVFLKEIKA
ncbi:L-aspartate--L-methionine ligase LdmS [Staphylococcus arlettae]|uniref:L-aspartate--L-methionine ligase LdmS n=1 Tax=Staphylococcus arlettae TaxID=29378 RepID=UPI000DCC86AB|nr:ATP-grasp domain-containing protein [Staphylococcus arlettae]MBF0738527.1 ATP-grasp domain-containing protein [Staphylococcus arlettae]RBA02683.1 hypothetical protein DOD23_1415 [Staphylococcus arlettae]RBA02872.1 hypothetical protein DOD22_1941 [Staphylococcus arlettae]RBA07652.1 hypothetical protein DOD24_0840 [Staphylococcus arlettae]TFU46075.1 ATP-grasp domain-containing protein [Staphylococcus arlettae]